MLKHPIAFPFQGNIHCCRSIIIHHVLALLLATLDGAGGCELSMHHQYTVSEYGSNDISGQ